MHKSAGEWRRRRRLDFRSEQSVSGIMQTGLLGPVWIPPACARRLWGFAVSATDRPHYRKGPDMPQKKSPKKTVRARSASRGKGPAGAARVAGSARRSETKQDAVLVLLSRPGGATIPAIVSATGWQPHSVRGFLAAVVSKKLGLTLTSEKTDGERIYRVVAPKPSQSKANRSASAPAA